MRFFLLLLACDSGNMGGQSQDLSVGDALESTDMPLCPGVNNVNPCTVSGQACDYGAMRCVCVGMYWQCNPSGCPDQPPTGSCSANGLSCSYNLSSSTCVDGSWLTCGDAAGQECTALQFGGALPQEGSACCANDYVGMNGMNGCGCIGGMQCSCNNFHVHCAVCDM
jgi:hypothetical protein